MASCRLIHRADDVELVSDFCLHRHELGNSSAGNFGRDRFKWTPIFAANIRLRIVRIDVRKPAGKPNHYDGLLFVIRFQRVLCFQTHEPCQTERGETGQANLHESAAVERTRAEA